MNTSIPTNKMSATGITGAIMAILLWALNNFWHIQLPGEVASALTILLSFVAGYLTPPTPTPPAPPVPAEPK